MKKIIFGLFLITIISFGANNEFTDTVSSIVSTAVEGSKEVATGIKQGIDQGIEKGKKMIVTIDNPKTFKEYVDIEITAIKNTKNSTVVTINYKNKSNKILRVTNLYNPENLFAIAKNKEKVFPSKRVSDVNLLKESEIEIDYTFDSTNLKKINIYNKQLNIRL